MQTIKKHLKELYYFLFQSFISKEGAEVDFWKDFLAQVQLWYRGELPLLYGEPAPSVERKIVVHSVKDSAILTWFEVHQKTKYREDLLLEKDAFAGMKILDVGSGPYPSAAVFEDAELYCLDPLLADYIKIGFPLHYYNNVKFISGTSENIPTEDNFFDAIISVNAIDHVNDLAATGLELKRVLKSGGKMRMHIHYHKKVVTEPIEMNDEVVKKVFSWCEGFKKISESKDKRGFALTDDSEMYTVWSN
ncbi:MAG: Methyltransferase type 11 [Candidatus Nomurabacteria bacterium]|nr:Methyltransferase type 11 [Candidatus Nomurabacteria bacterium]